MTKFQAFGVGLWGFGVSAMYFAIFLALWMAIVLWKNLFPSDNFTVAFLIGDGIMSVLLGFVSGRRRAKEVRRRTHLSGGQQYV